MAIVIVFVLLQISGIFARPCEHIKFIVHSPTVKKPFESTFCNNQTLLDACDNTGNYTIIVHQWLDSDTNTWKDGLISAYQAATNGCVIWMDYTYYSSKPLAELTGSREEFVHFFVRKLNYFEQLGFDPKNGHLFGYSIGSHFALEAAITYGPKKLGRIDCCDPSDTGFSENDPSVSRAADAAQNVQCMHTNNNLGTKSRFCPHDVNVGDCGRITTWANDGHLCAEYFIDSFKKDLNLVAQEAVEENYSASCKPKKTVVDVSAYDPPKKMGWQFDFTVDQGEFFCIPDATA